MAVDIKDAGILAGFELWGWPWHGLCTSGSIDLGGGLTHSITTPAHGSAWLIDRGLPAIDRSPAQLLVDAALGHQWRNYGMMSGGVVYGTQLGPNRFIHVDADGVRWMVSLSYSYPDAVDQKVRITLSIVQFGLFGEGVKTPITVVKDVQCTYYTYLLYRYTYDGPTTLLLEDVWTNGSKCLVSVAQTRVSSPTVKDIFSLIEITFSGSGGADGSGLVINAAEIMADTDLSNGRSLVADFDPTNYPVGGWDILSSATPVGGYCYTVTWVIDGDYIHWQASDTYDSLGYEYIYARFAYYAADGTAKAARLKELFERKYWYTSHASGSGGAQVCDPSGLDCAVGCTWDLTDCGVWATTTADGHAKYGIYLLENDTVIDSLEIHQDLSVLFERTMTGGMRADLGQSAGMLWGYTSPTGLNASGTGPRIEAHRFTDTDGTPVWQGSLVGALGLSAPGAFDDTGPLINLNDLADAWRSNISDHQASGDAVVVGTTVELGVQRIDAKAAAFYVPGTTRIYGTVLTPLGPKTTGLTPAANLYFAWQRKTGDFSFAASPICYV